MFECILFDFDGTLMDTSEGIFESIGKVAEHYGVTLSTEQLRAFIGPPLKESFPSIMGLPASEVQNAIGIYRKHYAAGALFRSRVYDGIEAMLSHLKAAGRRLFVTTSKPENFTKQILAQKGIAHFFQFVGGSDEDEKTRVEKADVIEYVLNAAQIADKRGECLLAGDRCYDVAGAHAVGIKCAGVLWGFGSKDEMSAADFLVDTPDELERLVLCGSL